MNAMQFKVFEAPEVNLPFTFNTSQDVYEKMKGYGKADRELSLILFMDNKNNVLKIATHTVGTVNSCAVYPREIIKSAIVNNSSSLVFVHQHLTPGSVGPSQPDREITKKLVYCAKLFDIMVLDHIIIGQGGYYSFADSGLIGDYERSYGLFDKSFQ